LRRSEWLSAGTGGDVFLKLETLQPTFSFKIRGAFNAVLALIEQYGQHPPPIVTASAGNHGQALAYAARAEGISLTVFLPATAPRTKTDAIRRMGAELVTCADYDEAESRAKAYAATGQALFVSPYSHPDVIAGAGTIGLELLDQAPDLDSIVVPVGGGGLAGGVAITAKSDQRPREVVGVEVEASTPFRRSLAAGRIVPIEVKTTLADGLAGNLDPDAITFELVQRLVDRMVVVSEPQLQQAIVGLLREERVVTEGAGATGVAAVLGSALDLAGRRIAVVVSGANIDIDTLMSLI
jgi:threonine dehydratase